MNNAPMLGHRHGGWECTHCMSTAQQRKAVARGRRTEERQWRRDQLSADMHNDDNDEDS